jgi:hypothetical protein
VGWRRRVAAYPLRLSGLERPELVPPLTQQKDGNGAASLGRVAVDRGERRCCTAAPGRRHKWLTAVLARTCRPGGQPGFQSAIRSVSEGAGKRFGRPTTALVNSLADHMLSASTAEDETPIHPEKDSLGHRSGDGVKGSGTCGGTV